MEQQPQIAAALNTEPVVAVAAFVGDLVEEGFEAVLTPKRSPASARPRIFDGAGERSDRTVAAQSRRRMHTMDVASAGIQSGRIKPLGWPGQRQHDRADIKKTS